MKRSKIKKFFALLENFQTDYPQLIKFLQDIDRFILNIIQAVLTLLGIHRIVRMKEEKITYGFSSGDEYDLTSSSVSAETDFSILNISLC